MDAESPLRWQVTILKKPFIHGDWNIGTLYNDVIAVDLARYALKGILTKTAVDPSSIDYVCMGTVIQEPKTSKYTAVLF